MGGGASATAKAASAIAELGGADAVEVDGAVAAVAVLAAGDVRHEASVPSQPGPQKVAKELRQLCGHALSLHLAKHSSPMQVQVDCCSSTPPLPGACGLSEDDADETVNVPGGVVALESTDVRQRRSIMRDMGVFGKYSLGAEVMPSANPDMQVRFATRHADGLGVVIKIRGKITSFCDSMEEQAWRRNTELVMNLPECASRARILEVCEDQCRYYVVMERVEGSDLYEFLANSGPLSDWTCREFLRQILTAISELHARGLIHKDLKLENVMVDTQPSTNDDPKQFDSTMSTIASVSSPTLKLVDFDTVEAYSSRSHALARTVIGTDQYIAHEAYAGMYSPASDMFAVGVIAYRLLTGIFPFPPKMFDDEVGENYVGSPKMKQIQDRLRAFSIDFTLPIFVKDPHATDFCKSLLAVEGSSRPSAIEALRHPFLSPSSQRGSASKSSKKMLFWR
mmetsp:Transcript_110754/g.320003  ORF Transcript_110754/g.320003 Transcript_110754/m.320003 type:complete len:453 (-) Transcript_110754:53-1411(-)